MEFGAHVSSGGGIDTAIDRIEAIGGDCVQVFTQSPRMWRPTEHKPEAIAALPRAAHRGGHRRRRLPRALPLQSGRAGRRDLREVDRDDAATVDAATRDRGRRRSIFHVGSHLGAGFEAGLERTCAALEQILERCEGDTWLLMENSAGTGGRSALDRRARDAARRLDRHPRLGICLDSCHLYASGYDVTDPAAVDELVAQVDATIGLDRLRALHVNDSATPLGSNRDRHANILEGELGEGLGAFLAHPAFQHLSAYLEVPGAKAGPERGRDPEAARPPRALDT